MTHTAQSQPSLAASAGPLGAAARASGDGSPDFDAIVRLCGPRLLGYFRHRLADGHLAEDLLQETFLRAFAARGRFDARRPPMPWLFRIARNVLVSHLRSQPPATGDEAARAGGRSAPADAEPAVQLARQEQAAGLWSMAAKAVPEAQFTALWLHYVEDMPVRQVATAMGKTSIHVRVLLHRARRRLADRLGEGRPPTRQGA